MENASKALYMAAAVLVGIMVIGIFVYVFRYGGSVGEKYNEKQSKEQLELYNSRFEAYDRTYNVNESKNINTISDMVSVANLAYSTNVDCSFDIVKAVRINIKIGNKWLVIPAVDMGLPKNTFFIEDTEKGNAFNKKIDAYSLLEKNNDELLDDSIKLDDISINLPVSNDEKHKDEEKLTWVDRDMNFKYRFDCTKIEYNLTSGRVKEMSFEAKYNLEYNLDDEYEIYILPEDEDGEDYDG